jgi:deoxyguanosine kinase
VNIPARFRFIAIEGPIGVGKTTLCKALAHQLNASTLLEKPTDNPFLARFYADRERYALPTQMTFLFERVDQFRAAAQGQLFEQRLVSDFFFEKDALFAKLTLSDEEYALYSHVYAHLAPSLTPPDCVIYLHAPVDALMHRIAERGIAMERRIEREYLERLAEQYAALFSSYSAAPVLTVNAAEFSAAEHPAHMAQLCEGLLRLAARSTETQPARVALND